MKLLANENFPLTAVDALRAQGYDVLWVRTEMPGATDEAVLSRARADSRTLITFAKDFGELAFRSGLAAQCGVILFRFTLTSPELAATRSLAVLTNRADWSGQFAVADESRIRFRPLP